jgi:hypothetical protein
VGEAVKAAANSPASAVSICTTELKDQDWQDWCLAKVGPAVAAKDPAEGSRTCDMVRDGGWQARCRDRVGTVPAPSGPPPDSGGGLVSAPMLAGGAFVLVLLYLVKAKLMGKAVDKGYDELDHVRQYVSEQRAQGHDDHAIRAALVRHDYPADVVEKVLKR